LQLRAICAKFSQNLSGATWPNAGDAFAESRSLSHASRFVVLQRAQPDGGPKEGMTQQFK
jgi:hypothetical protein